MEQVSKKKFKRPYIVVEKVFERVALMCGKMSANSGCQPNKKDS